MESGRILGPDGQPIRKEILTTEIARATMTGVRNIWGHGSIASGLTPEKLARLLRSAAEGGPVDFLTLAEEMEERDLHYAAVLGTRKRAVSGLEVIVESATDEAADIKIADAVRDLIALPDFGDLIDDCLDAIGKGYSVSEIMWDRSGKQWWPEQYIWRDPRFFRFDRVTGREIRLLDDENTFDGLPLEPFKFITHVPKLKSGLPIRRGVARLVSTAYMCKAFTITDWLAFAEIFGMPLRIGRYGPHATESDIRTLINAVANVGSDAAAVIPDGMKIEFEKGGTSSGGEELFEGLATYLDKQVSKGVLGQTMTTDDGSSRSQAQVHDEVRGDILRADVRQLENTLNRDLVRAFVDLNFGPQKRYPRIQLPVREPEDLKALAESLTKLVPLGLQVEESIIRDKFGIPEPANGALLLSAPATTPTEPALNRHHHTRSATARNRQKEDHDFFDELADDPLSEWEQQMAPMVAPLEKLLQESESYEDFMQGLQEIAEELDPSEIVRFLATATFKARGLGDASDDIDGS